MSLKPGKFTIIFAILALFITSLSGFIIYSLLQLTTQKANNSQSIEDKPTIDNSQAPKVEEAIEEEQDDMIKYVHPSGIFEFSYPKTWTISREAEGTGLEPIAEKKRNFGEIVTIGTVKTDKSLVTWSRTYDGSGYQVEKEMRINEYSAYYIFKADSELTMHIYTFKKGENIVRINFRMKDNASTPQNLDFSKYLGDFETIVNSIRYL